MTATQKSGMLPLQKPMLVEESGSTRDIVCKDNSTTKTQMLCITCRVGCSNSMKSCKDATHPSQYILQLQTSPLFLLTQWLFKPHLHPVLSKWYSHILALQRANTRTALKLHFTENKKLVFLDWAKFVNVVFTTSPAYSWGLKEAVRNWTASRSFQWHQLFFLKCPLLFLSRAPTAAQGRMFCTDKVPKITQNQSSFLNTCFPLI